MPLRYGAVLVYAAPEETWVRNDMACPLPEDSPAFRYFSSACFAHEEQAVPVLDTNKLFCETLPWTAPSPANSEPAETPSGTSQATETATNLSKHATPAPASPQESASSRRLRAQRVIGETLSAIHEEVGLRRVLLGVLGRDGSIRAHYYRGVERDSPLRSLCFQRGDSGLFARLMERPQHVWLRPANRDRLAPFISAELLNRLGAEEFFASSIFVCSRLLGVCYGDDFESTANLDDYRYLRFKELCTSMGKRLGEITA